MTRPPRLSLPSRAPSAARKLASSWKESVNGRMTSTVAGGGIRGVLIGRAAIGGESIFVDQLVGDCSITPASTPRVRWYSVPRCLSAGRRSTVRDAETDGLSR
jgi:hypothetical protein